VYSYVLVCERESARERERERAREREREKEKEKEREICVHLLQENFLRKRSRVVTIRHKSIAIVLQNKAYVSIR
jgi:hypothetical protein